MPPEASSPFPIHAFRKKGSEKVSIYIVQDTDDVKDFVENRQRQLMPRRTIRLGHGQAESFTHRQDTHQIDGVPDVSLPSCNQIETDSHEVLESPKDRLFLS